MKSQNLTECNCKNRLNDENTDGNTVAAYLDVFKRVDIGEAFEVDGATIRYPGDPQAPGYLVYNCRCTLVSAVKGIDQSGAARASKLGNMSYEEWKAGKGLEL